MSKKAAQEFIDTLLESAALRRKINEASEDIVKAARKAGFKVTRAEIADALKKHWFEVAEEGEAGIDPLNHVFSEVPGF